MNKNWPPSQSFISNEFIVFTTQLILFRAVCLPRAIHRRYGDGVSRSLWKLFLFIALMAKHRSASALCRLGLNYGPSELFLMGIGERERRGRVTAKGIGERGVDGLG